MTPLRIAAGTLAVLVVAATSACSRVTSGSPSAARVTSQTAAAPTTTSPLLVGPTSPLVPASAPENPGTATVATPTRSPAATSEAPQRTQSGVPQTRSALLRLYENSRPLNTPRFAVDDGLFFDLPSQNIGCFIADNAFISCSIHHYDFPQPGPDCSRGIAADVDSAGNSALTDCAHYFAVANRGSILHYGESISHNEVGCVSGPAGVSCLSLNTDRGFTLSREAFSQVR